MIKNLRFKQHIIVTGANGFTGRFVCQELKNNNLNFTAILRPKSDLSWIKKNNIKFKFADLNNFNELSKALYDCDTLINVASIGFGSAPTIIKACEAANLKRAIFVSTTSIFTKLNAESKKIRIKAENSIKNSNLIWTIVRPTMIYGTPRDRNIIKLIEWLDKFPIIPVFGDGESLQQPVHVYDVAKSLVAIVDKKDTFYKAFNLSGLNPITYNKLIKVISSCLQKKIYIIHFPAIFIIFILKIFEKIGIKLFIKSEQIARLNENKDFSHEKAYSKFNFRPISIEQGIHKEVMIYKNNRFE